MYTHPAFKADVAKAEAFLDERGFGTLVAWDGARPVGAHVPFLYDGACRRIELHVARPNPLHEVIGTSASVLLTCAGPDAYVSPDWYASQNQVPTWTYVAVHVSGRARTMDPAELPGHLDRLSAHFEARLPKAPWTAGKMDQQRLAAMMKAIVGIVIEVEAVEGNWKLNQHKPPPDHAGAVAGLRARGDAASLAVAALMDAARAEKP